MPRHSSFFSSRLESASPLAPLSRKIWLGRGALLWERLWPRLALSSSIAALFASLAWLGFFEILPAVPRLALAFLFALALFVSLVRLFLVRLPSAAEARARLDRDSGQAHHPLRTLADTQALGVKDPLARALWLAHVRQVARGLTGLRLKPPSPRLDRADPFALRAGVFLLAIIAVNAAWRDPLGPLVQAFRLPVSESPRVRIDAWITPPAYTGKAPVTIDFSCCKQAGHIPSAYPTQTIPEKSVLTVRISGYAAPQAFLLEEGSEKDAAPMAPLSQSRESDHERSVAFETTVNRSGVFIFSDGGRLQATGKTEADFWFDGARREDHLRFTVTPDMPPMIRLTEEPGATQRGALRLVYEVSDDYRVAGASALFANPVIPGTDGEKSATKPRPLFDPPTLPLTLPRRPAISPGAETLKDLSSHPWAGATVTLQLEARDDADNRTRTPPVTAVIPARPFRDPLAKMLIEQRRILALDAQKAKAVARMLDEIAFHAPAFIDDTAAYLGLRIIHHRILYARSDDDLRAVIALMWEMALSIDGGDASLAEERLREARQNLREALENGASPEEIAELTAALRQAMRDYMEALMRDPSLLQPAPAQENAGESREVSPQDLEAMTRKIEELAKLGDREAAEALLSELDQLMENLVMGAPPPGGNSAMDERLNALADMIRRQQELMNETFGLSPEGTPRRQEEAPPSREAIEEALRRLQEGQNALRQELEKLGQELGEEGLGGGEELGEAGSAMGEAGEALGQGDGGRALERQGSALDALRRGAQDIARQLGLMEGGAGEGEAEGRDPLGRTPAGRGSDLGASVKVPDEIDIQRARRILNELRKRFSDQNRPALERDYLERLLDLF